ncbi:MAG TPA: pitrilysin family protein [Roseateles sp.]|nr:pitrilysin family protein [Roseateles sp.]
MHSAAGPTRRSLLAWAAGAGLAGALGAQPLALPPLGLQSRRLDNGLAVIAVPMSSSTVAVQLWYRVGSKDDPIGRSGFAHLFEHMMFKSTRHLASEQFDRLTEDVGGSNNAFTAEDMTVYHSVVPANHLEPLLWAEAERMANLNVDQAAFESERAVVREEYRQRVLADPYGRLFNAIPAYGYQQHPYKRPVIGNIEELDAATLKDVRDFHAAYYRPDNAVLIVAGAFDPGRLDAWVDHYFGSIPKPRGMVPQVAVAEPRRTREERHRMAAPGVPLPAALLIWQGPRSDSTDVPALQLAQALLAQGDSARLAEALVYREHAAQSIGFELLLNADAGLLAAHAIAAGPDRPEALLERLAREIERLAEEPVQPRELDKAKAQLLTQALIDRETPEGRALAVGNALLLRGSAAAAEREIPQLLAVTQAEVQRALRRYVLQGARVELLYLGEGAAR